jgi:hypothetical protein
MISVTAEAARKYSIDKNPSRIGSVKDLESSDQFIGICLCIGIFAVLQG